MRSKKYRCLLSACLLLLISEVYAQTLNIIPQPASVKQPKIAANFTITPTTLIVLEGSNMDNSISFFNDYLKRFYGFKLKVVKASTSKNSIRLNYERMDETPAGAYIMTVDNNGVYIAGDNEDGVFYGIQTLIQLLPINLPVRQAGKLTIPYVSIEDQPRFAYRGMHLDVSRHFMTVDLVKRYIDYIAMHKMNYFHWHLTDDQGWRIEIKKYPKLTQAGAWRNGTIIGRYPGTGNDKIKYGGYYTQEQIKDVIAYAQKRYITIIPEIEMPGHGSAAIAAYPELSCFPTESTQHPKQCAWNGDSTGKQVQQTWGVFEDVFCAGKDNTFDFLQNVLDEVTALFPATYVHIGGDECPKANWKRCPVCQKRMKDLNLKDEHELQSYFIQRVETYLNKKGKKIIGWDEILEGGLAANATVMSWRGEEGGIAAAKQNHDVIMTPGGWCYLDHSQSQNEDSVTIGDYLPVEKVYGYEPVPASLTEEQAKHILGAQGNVWTEYIGNIRKVEYMIFPRMSALSEVLWSSKEKKNWQDFEERLMLQFKRYDLWKSNYSKAYFDLTSVIEQGKDGQALQWKIVPKKDDPVGIKLTISSKNETGQADSTAIYDLKDPTRIVKYIIRKPGEVYTESYFHNNLTGHEIPAFSINYSGDYMIEAYHFNVNDHESVMEKTPFTTLKQTFRINKATGKKITLTTQASRNHPGDGPFTLVNGVINQKGMTRSREFLGFLGTDCEAVIDLGRRQTITHVKVHILNQTASWIWRPQYVEVFSSSNGVDFTSVGMTDDVSTLSGKGILETTFNNVEARYIKVVVKNWGVIPDGNPGVGNKAWLFVDEIEVN